MTDPGERRPCRRTSGEASLDVGAPAPGRAGAPRRRRWRPRPWRTCATTSRRSSSSRRSPPSATGTRRRTAGSPATRTPDPAAAAEENGTNGVGAVAADPRPDAPEPVGRRRRGRVTRTGGAPTATAGDAPAVAVVTVPWRRPPTRRPSAGPESQAPSRRSPAVGHRRSAPSRRPPNRRCRSRGPGGPGARRRGRPARLPPRRRVRRPTARPHRSDRDRDRRGDRERGRPGLTLTKAVPYPGDLRRASHDLTGSCGTRP